MACSKLLRYLPLLFVLTGCEKTPPTPSLTTIPFAPDSGDIAVRCGELIDGISDETLTDKLVVIRNGQFKRITDGAVPPLDDVAFLDLSSHTCLPGLEGRSFA